MNIWQVLCGRVCLSEHVTGFPGLVGSPAAGPASQFSTPAKGRRWFLFPSKGAGNLVVFPYPLFTQTVSLFKGYLLFCFEHFMRHIAVYSSKSLEYNWMLFMLYWMNTYLFCLCYFSFLVYYKKICIMGQKYSMDSLNILCVPVLRQSSVCN